MLDVRRLRLLCDLARLDTIAAVAQAHMYTPSAVSQQLSALEREVGMPLLERSRPWPPACPARCASARSRPRSARCCRPPWSPWPNATPGSS
jgi:DNA-binding transcriptional ArsR family regulator